MQIDFAPMEGITGYPFRNAFFQCIGGVDRYFTPFINVNQNLKFGRPEERDIAPEHNRVKSNHMEVEVPFVPQLLTNHADQLAWGITELANRGFQEMNLNLGCPSATVMKRHRGSGLLEDPDELGLLLEEAIHICEGQGLQFIIDQDQREECQQATGSPSNTNETASDKELYARSVKFSVKTRIGMSDAGRMEELVHVYNQLPLSEVIVHPRIGTQGYGGVPDYEKYGEFLSLSTHPVIYNGDINSAADAKRILMDFPETSGLMLGRGLLKDPLLAWKIRKEVFGEEVFSIQKAEFLKYHDTVFENYREYMREDRNAMARMKEFWVYFGQGLYFREGRERDKALKQIRKAKNREEYEAGVERMMEIFTIASDNE